MSRTIQKPKNTPGSLTPVERGRLAAKAMAMAMAKKLVTDHKRWKMPLLS